MKHYPFNLIHDNTPEEMIPPPERMKKFLSECNGEFGTDKCVFWGITQDKYVTIDVCDQRITTKKDVNMYFFLNGKLRNVKTMTFSWCYGYVPDATKYINMCQHKGCINPCHLTFSGFNATTFSNIKTKFKPTRNDRIVEAMEKIHPDTPLEYIPDYSSFTKFLSNCKGDWEDTRNCVYWSGSSKRFCFNKKKISPQNLSYLWISGEIPLFLTKNDRICRDHKCINMHHFKAGFSLDLSEKRRKIEENI